MKELQLCRMYNLRTTPNFDGLSCLQNLTLDGCRKLEKIHPSLGNHRSIEYINISNCRKLRMFPTIVHMENLKTLRIDYCCLEDRGVSSGIGGLSYLEVLSLCGNEFSRLDFSLTKLTRLKSLNLNGCKKLVKLPELPASLAILNAYRCDSLATVSDFHITCEWLCQLSLWGEINHQIMINNGGRLLQSVFEVYMCDFFF